MDQAGISSSNASLLSQFDTSDEIDELILSLLPPSELEILEKEAAAFVGSSLILQENLEKKGTELLEQVNRDRDEALLALRNTTSEQLTSIRRGKERFSRAEANMKELAASFAEMDSLISTMQSVSSYHQIRQLHYYHENLSSIVKWSETLEAFSPSSTSSSSDAVGTGAISSSIGEAPSAALERQMVSSAVGLSEVYNKLRTLQSIRARLAIPGVASHHRVSISVIKKNLDEGERVLFMFVNHCFDLFRRAPEICCEYISTAPEYQTDPHLRLTDEGRAFQAKIANDRQMLFAAIRVANQEAREPALYTDVNVAAYHLHLSLQRMAGKGGEVARPDSVVTSLLSLQQIQRHLDVGARTFFLDYVVVDPSNAERKNLSADQLLADVVATCDAIDQQLDPLAECIEKAMEPGPIGPVQIVSQLMKTLHSEVCTLIEVEYCNNPNIAVADLLRVLELTVQYKENCLERGTIGQFVAPTAMDDVSTRVLEVAVFGMRDYLATNARNCVLRVIDKDVKAGPDGTFSTTGPSDLLFVVTAMLKTVTKNATSDVRSKMSMACATALRYYTDRFCDKLEFAAFEKWYQKIIDKQDLPAGTVVPVGDRWCLWICAAINDFLELQRNVGKLDASLFDLHHQATSSVAPSSQQQGGAGGTAAAGAAAGAAGDSEGSAVTVAVSSSLTPLQTFASILGEHVLVKLIGWQSDYLELHALSKVFNTAFQEKTFLARKVTDADALSSTGPKPSMQDFIDELRSYVLSIQASVISPWDSVASHSIVARFVQLYIQKLLAAIYDGLDSKVTRSVLSARIADDMRQWTLLAGELGELKLDQLRFEDRSNAKVVPNAYGAVAALRVLLHFSSITSAKDMKLMIEEDVSCFSDVPEWLFDVMIDSNKAQNDLPSRIKEECRKLWKEHIAFQNSTRGASAAAADKSDNNDDEDGQRRLPKSSVFSTIDKDCVIPKKTGWFSRSRAGEDKERKVGYRMGFVNICLEAVQIREMDTTLPRLGRGGPQEIETISLAELLARDKEKSQGGGAGGDDEKKKEGDA